MGAHGAAQHPRQLGGHLSVANRMRMEVMSSTSTSGAHLLPAVSPPTGWTPEVMESQRRSDLPVSLRTGTEKA